MLVLRLLSGGPLGLHITAIRKFIEDHPEVKSKSLTTSQINSAFIKPETKGTDHPYIQKYATKRDKKTEQPLVSSATVFVSHAWRYSFYDIVFDVMEQYASKHPDTYFWFDLFTNNQNEISNKDFDWFSTTFRNTIEEIGQVLLVLSPWDDPMPIKRAWCLFEIHNALEGSEVLLNVNLPSKEVGELKAGVIADSECIIKVLSDIQAEKAEAKNTYERDLIFDVIKKSGGGFPYVNKQIKDGLRKWYISQLESLIVQEGKNSALLMHTANVMRSFGFHDSALLLYNKTLRLRLDMLGPDHPQVSATYTDMTTVYQNRQELDTALEYYLKSLEITLKV